jgi:hypothetical protein
MQYPMPAGGDKLRAISNLIYRNKADPKSACRAGLSSLVARRDMPKTVEITPMTVCAVCFPGALEHVDMPAITEDAVIVHDKRIVTYIEAHRLGIANVVRILDQFMCESAISLKIAEFRAEISEVVNASRQEFGAAHCR